MPSRHGGRDHHAFESGEQEAVKKGMVYRSSDIVETVVNQRYAAVFGSVLVTFRRDTDAKPTKVWALRNAVIEPPKEVECDIKSRGTSTIMAMVAGKYQKKQLFGVKIVFESADPLTLYTEAPEEAQSWHAALSNAVSTASGSGLGGLAFEDVGLGGAGRAPSGYSARGSMTAGASPTARARLAKEGALPTAARGSSVPKRKTRTKWAALMHVNGTAVYQEQQGAGGSGGALMASLVVRATPTDTFETLLDIGNALTPSASDVKLEEVSDHRSIHRLTLQPEGGWLGWCSAPREMVMSRTWRYDDEGTYVILFQSVNHPAAPEPKPSMFNWTTPVRMNVPAAGITIAPLRQYAGTDVAESPESLLTIVIKADPGGWLGSGILPALFGRTNVQLAVLRPFLSAMIATRDRVEQERFVIQPLEFDAEEGEQEQEERAGGRTTLDVLDHNFRTKSLLQAKLIQEEMGQLTQEQLAERMAQSPDRVLRAYAGGTCPEVYWSCPGAAGFKVRGPKYLQDRKKVEAGEPAFELLAVDLVRTQDKSFHVAPHLPSLKFGDAPFTFVFNLMVPGPPFLSLIVSWAAPMDPTAPGATAANAACAAGVAASVKAGVRDDASVSPSALGDVSDEDDAAHVSPIDVALARFMAGDDNTRNGYLKLIPKMIQASWIIKQAVGSTPVILGRKLTTTYHTGKLSDGRGYVEVDVDIGSSSAASSVVGLVQPATKSLVMDIAVLLEGIREDELPEALLGTVRLTKLDLGEYKYLDMSDGMVYSRDDAPPEVQAWK